MYVHMKLQLLTWRTSYIERWEQNMLQALRPVCSDKYVHKMVFC